MHLRYLRWCGYVTTRRDGRYIFYSLGASRVTEILRLAKELLRGTVKLVDVELGTMTSYSSQFNQEITKRLESLPAQLEEDLSSR